MTHSTDGIKLETASENDSTAKAASETDSTIQRQIKGGRYFELVCSAGSVWLDTQSQYCGIDDTPTTTTKTYQINNLRILYTRGDAFNG